MDLIQRYKFDLQHERPKIAVIGDLMLDEHVLCEVLGISPEDDLAYKMRVLSNKYTPGGAANVALNVAALGGEAYLYGVCGMDPAAEMFHTVTQAPRVFRCVYADKMRTTTLKTRYLTPRGRHVARIDREQIVPMGSADVTRIIDDIQRRSIQLIVVSDYAKGVVTDELLTRVKALGVPYLVDPKSVDFLRYGEALVMTPNEKELRAATFSTGTDTLLQCVSRLKALSQAVLVTLAGEGAELFVHDLTQGQYRPLNRIPVRKREFGDPCGCGDSLLAGLAYATACHWPLLPACNFASAVGACAMDHEGTRAVSSCEVLTELSTFNYC